MILLHIAIVCVLEVIYVYCIHGVEILHNGGCCCASLSKSPCSVIASCQFDIGHTGSIYTTETGKCYESRLFLPSPRPVVKYLPLHNCLHLSSGACPWATGAHFQTLGESPKLLGVSLFLPPPQVHQAMTELCSLASRYDIHSRAPHGIHMS